MGTSSSSPIEPLPSPSTFTRRSNVSAKVVIIGGGYAGCAMARYLEAVVAEVTLIERRPVFVHHIAGLRAMLDPSLVSRMLIPYSHLFKASRSSRHRVVQAEVTGVDVRSGKILLDNGDAVRFDFLVVASGGPQSMLGKGGKWRSVDELKSLYEGMATRIHQSDRVLIIGGGPIGTELAAEISTTSPSKQVTLLHSGSSLCSGCQPPCPPSFTADLLNRLTGKGVNVILNDRIDLSGLPSGSTRVVPGPLSIRTRKGRLIDTDLVLVATGRYFLDSTGVLGKGKTEGFLKTLGPREEVLTHDGRVRVNEHLQVVGHSRIFAVGDAADLPETSLAQTAVERQVPVILHNILLLAREGQDFLGATPPQPAGAIASSAISDPSCAPSKLAVYVPATMRVGGAQELTATPPPAARTSTSERNPPPLQIPPPAPSSSQTPSPAATTWQYPTPMFISLGPKDGVGFLVTGERVPPPMVTTIKSHDLYTNRWWSFLQNPPTINDDSNTATTIDEESPVPQLDSTKTADNNNNMTAISTDNTNVPEAIP